MKQRKRNDEDGPRIHRTEQKDEYKKHRKVIYDIIDEDEFKDITDIWDEKDEDSDYDFYVYEANK